MKKRERLEDNKREPLIEVPKGAVGIQVVRVVAGDVRFYDAIEFTAGRRAVDRTVRILRSVGYIAKSYACSDSVMDLLDSDGSVVADVPLAAKGRRYLLKRFGMRVVKDDAEK